MLFKYFAIFYNKYRIFLKREKLCEKEMESSLLSVCPYPLQDSCLSLAIKSRLAIKSSKEKKADWKESMYFILHIGKTKRERHTFTNP